MQKDIKMDQRSRLEILHSDGGIFSNYSLEAQDFKRDTFSITLTTDDFIYVGFRKDINALYFQIDTANTVPAELTFEYYTTDSVWANLSVSDETRAFSRSGFATWQRPSDGQAVAVDGQEMCWVRISANVDLDPVTFMAINILFSDDNTICDEAPALVDPCFYQQGQSSHILHHVSAKKYIMSRLRSQGYIKHTSNGEENINEWDILDIYELREAANFYTIAQIYFNLSDTVEDQYWAKYREYKTKFEEAFSLGRLRIDSDDDGQEDLEEKRPIKSHRWVR